MPISFHVVNFLDNDGMRWDVPAFIYCDGKLPRHSDQSNQDSIPFGAVVQRSTSKKHVIMKNNGDIGTGYAKSSFVPKQSHGLRFSGHDFQLMSLRNNLAHRASAGWCRNSNSIVFTVVLSILT